MHWIFLYYIKKHNNPVSWLINVSLTGLVIYCEYNWTPKSFHATTSLYIHIMLRFLLYEIVRLHIYLYVSILSLHAAHANSKTKELANMVGFITNLSASFCFGFDQEKKVAGKSPRISFTFNSRLYYLSWRIHLHVYQCGSYVSLLSPAQTSNFSLTSFPWFYCKCVRGKIDEFSLTRNLV